MSVVWVMAALGLSLLASDAAWISAGWMTSQDVAARAIDDLSRRDEVDESVAQLAAAELLTAQDVDAGALAGYYPGGRRRKGL